VVNAARWACAFIALAAAMIVWIVTGYADPVIGAVVVPMAAAVLGYALGPGRARRHRDRGRR
jgi:hypothetical protein